MKFIYCTNPDVTKDLESAGLRKLGRTVVNGKMVDIFENSKEIYISKYQKQCVFFANQLFFTPIDE
jgi:hypothetical protein